MVLYSILVISLVFVMLLMPPNPMEIAHSRKLLFWHHALWEQTPSRTLKVTSHPTVTMLTEMSDSVTGAPFFLTSRIYLVLYFVVTFRHSCFPVFAWRSVMLRFFDPKQLLRVSCILWCYFSKCYYIILHVIFFNLIYDSKQNIFEIFNFWIIFNRQFDNK